MSKEFRQTYAGWIALDQVAGKGWMEEREEREDGGKGEGGRGKGEGEWCKKQKESRIGTLDAFRLTDGILK